MNQACVLLARSCHLMSGDTLKIDACSTAPRLASDGTTDRSDETTCRGQDECLKGHFVSELQKCFAALRLAPPTFYQRLQIAWDAHFFLGKQRGHYREESRFPVIRANRTKKRYLCKNKYLV